MNLGGTKTFICSKVIYLLDGLLIISGCLKGQFSEVWVNTHVLWWLSSLENTEIHNLNQTENHWTEGKVLPRYAEMAWVFSCSWCQLHWSCPSGHGEETDSSRDESLCLGVWAGGWVPLSVALPHQVSVFATLGWVGAFTSNRERYPTRSGPSRESFQWHTL